MSSSKPSFMPPDYGQIDNTVTAAQQDSGYVIPPEERFKTIEDRLDAIENLPINLNTDITGLFEVVSVVPVNKPKNIYDQLKIYHNGATKTLYLFDYPADLWRSVTLT